MESPDHFRKKNSFRESVKNEERGEMKDWDSKGMRRQVGLGDRPRTVVGHRLSQWRGQHLNF